MVGVSCYVEPASWGVWQDLRAALVPHAYVAALQRAGATVVVLPPSGGAGSDADADAREVLTRIDGLVLAGGVDVEPARYGEAPHPSVQESRPDRDDAELALVRAAIAVDLPLLGICRGMEVMAVAAGGSLVQHLPDVTGTTAHAPAPAAYAPHAVTTVPGTLVAALLGEVVVVPSYHHQAGRAAPGYIPAGHSGDGTLEAMERSGTTFHVGVQWHPEVGDDPRLFEAVVRAAAGP